MLGGEERTSRADVPALGVGDFERDAPNTLGGQVLLGDTIYGTNQEGPAAAEFATGKLRWRADGIGPGAIFFAEDRLYFHGENGDVALAEATPEAYREKGRFTPPDQPESLFPNPIESSGVMPFGPFVRLTPVPKRLSPLRAICGRISPKPRVTIAR